MFDITMSSLFFGRPPTDPAKRQERAENAMIMHPMYFPRDSEGKLPQIIPHTDTQWYVLAEHANVPLEELQSNSEYQESYKLMLWAGWVS